MALPDFERMTPEQRLRWLEELVAERMADNIFERLLAPDRPEWLKLIFESNPPGSRGGVVDLRDFFSAEPPKVQTSAPGETVICWPARATPHAQLSPREGHCPAAGDEAVSGAKRLED